MEFKIKGLDELQRNLRDLERRAQNVSGPVTFDDLFPPEFMRRYTDFKDISELVSTSGYEVNSSEDFAKIPDAAWDAHIVATTRFESWEDMKTKAGEEFAARRLGF